jgi:DHA2 family multidrug resistance protein
VTIAQNAIEAAPPARRYLILATVSSATMLYAMAITIANVVLPQMRGALSASPDQIAWVVTFNLVATAIVTPISGWLSARFGRRNVMLVGTLGFTLSSVFCGMSDSLELVVLFRIGQGAFGAPLVPVSQAIVLDTFPRRQHGFATALWGMGVVTGPIIGPTVGGHIAELYDWRWVFYMIVPFGLLTLAGVYAFIEDRSQRGRPLDWTGFLALAAGLGALQMMMDRGERNQWFESPETIVEAALGVIALYFFMVHIMTARRPFISPGLFLNWNYSLGLFLAFMFGMLNFAPLVLMPTLLQELRGYPDSIIGNLLAIRGAGNMISFLVVVRLANWDARVALAIGFASQAVSGWAISQLDINMTYFDIAWTGFLQGFGIGMTWVPLTLIMFSTVKPAQLDEASAVFHMLRNFASSVFISVLVAVVIRTTYINNAEIGEALSLFNKTMFYPWVSGPLDFSDTANVAMASGELRRQAALIAYLNAFKVFTFVALIPIPFIWLARLPKERD